MTLFMRFCEICEQFARNTMLKVKHNLIQNIDVTNIKQHSGTSITKIFRSIFQDGYCDMMKLKATVQSFALADISQQWNQSFAEVQPVLLSFFQRQSSQLIGGRPPGEY